jgi:hypothetical protein
MVYRCNLVLIAPELGLGLTVYLVFFVYWFRFKELLEMWLAI